LGRHDGEVGHNARKLVRTWKAVVAEHVSEDSESDSDASHEEEEDATDKEPEINKSREPNNENLSNNVSFKTNPHSGDEEDDDYDKSSNHEHQLGWFSFRKNKYPHIHIFK